MPGCVHRREDFAFAFGAGLLESVIPGGAAAGDGGVGVGGRIVRYFGHTILQEEIDSENSVRVLGEILCKGGAGGWCTEVPVRKCGGCCLICG